MHMGQWWALSWPRGPDSFLSTASRVEVPSNVHLHISATVPNLRDPRQAAFFLLFRIYCLHSGISKLLSYSIVFPEKIPYGISWEEGED